MWNINKSIEWINKNAKKDSIGSCAKYVRMAMDAGGLSTDGRPVAAFQYADFLPKKGFAKVAVLNGKAKQNEFIPNLGDIAVMKHGKYGHICMWNGSQWISDFKQNNMWPYSGEGVCEIFRYT